MVAPPPAGAIVVAWRHVGRQRVPGRRCVRDGEVQAPDRVGFFLSGAAGLLYQVVWSRQLHLVLGSTTEAVGVVLATFMAGLGLGALLSGGG